MRLRRYLMAAGVAVTVTACAYLPVKESTITALQELPAKSRQAVIVIPDRRVPHRATVTLWERQQDEWQMTGKVMAATVGRSGIAPSDSKREGDGRTPSGTFDLKRAFGYAKDADTGLDYRMVSTYDFWVDDPTSDQYNRWVRVKPEARSYETLRRDDDLYKYAVVVEYNTGPIVRGAGSAIFLHVWKDENTATAGCIALKEDHLKQILGWLDAAKNPVIFIRYHDQ